ncbi:MAG: DUF4364 family protein [Clostridia bacterium]
MPLQSPMRKVSDAENRLRVLFCLDALGMASQEQLWPFIASLELMEYVPFCLYVDDLRKDGSLMAGNHALAGILYLTEEGRATLTLFLNRMPRTDRDHITRAAPAYAAQLTERRQVRAVYESAEGGMLRVACTVRESDVPTLFLRLQTRKRSIASLAIKRFRPQAPRVLMLLYDLALSEQVKPPPLPCVDALDAALAQAAPGAPVLVAHGKHDHSAVVCLDSSDVRYTVALLLSSREAAELWACAALQQEAALVSRLNAMLASHEDGVARA